MTPTPPDVQSIFGRALEIESSAGRAAYLDEACGADAGLRAEVEGLLAANRRAGEFMRRPAAAVAAGITGSYEPLTEGPGTRIGPYKLLQLIGEGGMGVVYMAEQEEPVRRKVALKIIKPGMDSRQVVARFEAERQALAMMDHANIARVFDAGPTESGRPYFVMELVHGVPITEYCDANKLTPRERLELFVPVCQAIQHAHQKGIIHRDIKPSNILVTMYDDKPVPKVIDFGVAKAVEQRLTEKTLFTQFGALVGTFEYMSPEQAEMNAFGVDTRSDIYALGVLLYELLTGTTPLERQRLREAAFSEIVRLIKEEDPQRPSVRLSTSGTRAKVAAARKTEPAKLSRLMRGELDWVVMRCLEKDRSRRYDTASGLAKDLERYLKDEPVEARPPSAWYRLSKTIRRNRTALTVSGVVAAALILGTCLAVWQAKRADEAENARIAQKKIDDDAIAALAKAKADADRQYALDRAIEAAFSGDLVKADKAIVEAEKAGIAADQSHWLRGLVHHQRGENTAAIKEFESSVAIRKTVAAQSMLAHCYLNAALRTNRIDAFSMASKARQELDSLTPETAEDYMCRGYGGSPLDVDRAMADLNKAIDMRDSPIARTFRAGTAAFGGFNQFKPELFELAIDDIRRAKARLADSPFVRCASLNVCLLAAAIYHEKGLVEKEKAALEEARGDAPVLAGLPVRDYVMARVFYFDRIGDAKAALAELDQASSRTDIEPSDLVWRYAMRLYQMGRDADALRVLDERSKQDSGPGQMLRINLLAEQPDIGRDKAYDRYREMVASDQNGSIRQSPFAVTTLLFLGKKKEAMDLVEPSARKYLSGSLSETDFLKDVGATRMSAFAAHCTVGMVRLSDGDRAGALEHFEKARDTKFYGFPYYPYALAYIERLKRDPKWPGEWIKPKK